MAMSNRDRVGRGLEILAAGLSPFVDARMTAAAPGGKDWVEMLQARDAARHGGERQYSRSDPRFLLRVITEEWRAFKDQLSRGEQSFASELRETGNQWAHGDAFSSDDTYRALDTMERLLTAVDAADEAAEVRKLRLDALWQAGDAAPLLMPGGIPLDSERVRSELTQYLEDDFKPVIDIDGNNSTPAEVDRDRPTLGQRKVTRRIARAIFLGSAATLKAAHKGIEQPSVWLGVAVPGDTVGNFGSALHLLSDRTTFLYSDGDRYWYDTQASVARIARDYADRLRDRPDDVWAEIVRRLTDHEMRSRGAFARVHIGSEDTGDIPDDPAARLVILHPQYRHTKGDEASPAMTFARRALDTRGSSQRMNRNMVVFLAPDTKRMEELSDAVRDYLAWKSIAGSEERIEELGLGAQQAARPQAAQGRRRCRHAADRRHLPLGDRADPAAARPPGHLGCAPGRRREGPARRTSQRQTLPS
jgi:Swt1-like HEPN